MLATYRISAMSPTRRALLAAGTAVLSLSLALSIAPAFAKNAPSTGTVKLHDVTNGVTVDDSANDPHVCTFTVVFQLTEPTQAGTWLIQTWPASNPPTVMAQGLYDTSANGYFETGPMTFAPGHYRLEWQANDANGNGSKNKTFWVDACGGAPTESASSDPTAPPSDDPTPTPTPTEVASSDPTAPPSDDPTPTPTPTEVASSSGNPNGGVADVTASETPGAGESAVLNTPASSAAGQLPNTSAPEPPTALLTVFGLLLVLAAHPFIRRSAHADRA
jgi:hypothetical protein